MATDEYDRNTLIHLYRGELGRMTTYRVRLDTTSNWALGASVTVSTFTLGAPSAPHFVMLLPVALTVVFALLEAQRMQDLELIRMRVRLLERGFFAPSLGRPGPADWAAQLSDSLAEPRSPLRLIDALAVRLRRNYLWLFATLYAAWGLKLWTSGEALLTAASVGPAPGWLALALAGVVLLAIVIIAARARPRSPG
ncbi:MAG: DUF2270 domain-containing protein [Myxococcales bacterium]|nr:DUF2270 domain-containing protein [Myxococcales bacterium]